MGVQQHRAALARRVGVDLSRLVLRFNPTEVGIVDATSDETERLRTAVFRYWADLGLQTEQEEQEVEMMWARAKLISV